MAIDPQHDIIALTAKVVAAYTSNNTFAAQQIPDIIRSVHAAFLGLASGAVTASEETPVPAVPIKRSVFPDYIICLEDGKKLKMLRRHLQNAYGMTPEQYRQRWNLPRDYPMTAPNYAAKRSDLAKKSRLGQKPRPPEASPDDLMSAKETAGGETAIASTEPTVTRTRPHSKKKPPPTEPTGGSPGLPS